MATLPYQKLSLLLISELQPRARDILLKRFGLGGQEPETLESIGHTEGITRERVRQIVQDSIEQIKEVTPQKRAGEKLEGIFEQLSSILEETGHLKRQDLLLKELGAASQTNSVIFILHLGDRFYQQREAESYYPFWGDKREIGQLGLRLLEKVIEYFQVRNETLSFEDLAAEHRDYGGEKIEPQTLASLLEISKLLARSYEGKWGLREWPHVYPKGVRDKAYVALRSYGKPLHFVQVAHQIEHLQDSLGVQHVDWKRKPVLPQTVHNELIKDPRFVIVGRGKYALAEWGFKRGTVKEVMKEILLQNSAPMSKEEIVHKTLAQRDVRESTILLNLKDKTCFVRQGGGYICIDK